MYAQSLKTNKKYWMTSSCAKIFEELLQR